jgi:hypothetical protein
MCLRRRSSGEGLTMCRSIVRLQRPPGSELAEAGDAEIEAAARQFVRKVSGSRVPSRANEEAFERTVTAVAGEIRELLDGWVSPGRAPARTAPKGS